MNGLETAMWDAAAMHYLGNKELLALHKVAFLCSRNCPAAVREKSRQWAVSQRENGICVISGYHSPIEKEVLHLLLAGIQPIIIVLAKGLTKKPEPELQGALDKGRLLIVTRYADSVSHACEQSCYQRNRLMLELAEETVVAYASPGGNLERLWQASAERKISLL